MSIISDCADVDASDINNLIEYLQQFLPLKMEKEMESIKMSKMTDDNGNGKDIDARTEEMGNELKNIYVDTRYYLNQRNGSKMSLDNRVGSRTAMCVCFNC